MQPQQISLNNEAEDGNGQRKDKDQTFSNDEDCDQDQDFPDYSMPVGGDLVTKVSQSEIDVDQKVNELLSKASLYYIRLPLNLNAAEESPELGIIICIDCKKGLTRNQARSHYRKEHKISISEDTAQAINKFLVDNNDSLVDKSDSIPPYRHLDPYWAPVNFLPIQKGYLCLKCGYCCPKKQSMRTHWYSKGHANVDIRIQYRPVYVQCYFKSDRRYFPVNQLLANVSSGSLYSLFMEEHADIIQEIQECSAVGKPALTTLEIPPMLQVTQWHDHLQEYTKDSTKISNIRMLMQPPSQKEAKSTWLGHRLSTLIWSYMEIIACKARKSPLKVRELLMMGRR